MLKRLIVSILLLINLMAHGQEKVFYDANAEKRTVDSFHALYVSDGIDVYITQSEEEGLVVSANELSHRDKIKTIVENGVLKISLNEGWNWKNRKLRAYISVKTIDKIRASGGSDVIIRGTLKCDKLAITLSGGSDLVGELSVTDLLMDQSGGSDARVKGNVVNLKVDVSGGSDFKGFECKAVYAILHASGGSDADIMVEKEMAAEASGGGSVNYKGSPVIKYKAASGGASVRRIL